MALTINTNMASLNAQRHLAKSQTSMAQSMQRLSSGLRISSAKDDAAGLAISNRMTAQIRGLNQATRNANDAISLAQTAEGALGEITNILQRGRELAVQASNTAVTSSSDRTAMQAEISQLLSEVNRIAEDTEFNGVNVLNHGTGKTAIGDQTEIDIQNFLRGGALKNAEQVVKDQFGLTATGIDMEIMYEEGSVGGAIAWVTSYLGGDGSATKVELHIDKADFENGVGISYDRIIAHELTHAIQASALNYDSTSNQFREGTAEFIHGGDYRLAADLAAGTNDRAEADSIAALADDLWAGGSRSYSAAYAAYRYLNEEMKSNGSNGIEDMMTWMAEDKTRTMNDAFNHAAGQGWIDAGYTTEALFLTDFAKDTVGGAYIDALRTGGELSNADTGAAGGLDADNGFEKTDTTVIPDTEYSYTDDPMEGFAEVWQEVALPKFNSVEKATFHVGANANQQIQISYGAADTTSLGIADVDISTNANGAIDAFDRAIDFISSLRGDFGAVQNRLESVVSNLRNVSENLSAARSRILDADIAKETADMTKNSILRQAGISILAQANAAPNAVLSLIN